MLFLKLLHFIGHAHGGYEHPDNGHYNCDAYH